MILNVNLNEKDINENIQNYIILSINPILQIF